MCSFVGKTTVFFGLVLLSLPDLQKRTEILRYGDKFSACLLQTACVFGFVCLYKTVWLLYKTVRHHSRPRFSIAGEIDEETETANLHCDKDSNDCMTVSYNEVVFGSTESLETYICKLHFTGILVFMTFVVFDFQTPYMTASFLIGVVCGKGGVVILQAFQLEHTNGLLCTILLLVTCQVFSAVLLATSLVKYNPPEYAIHPWYIAGVCVASFIPGMYWASGRWTSDIRTDVRMSAWSVIACLFATFPCWLQPEVALIVDSWHAVRMLLLLPAVKTLALWVLVESLSAKLVTDVVVIFVFLCQMQALWAERLFDDASTPTVWLSAAASVVFLLYVVGIIKKLW